jgi:hypothetical protein
MNTDFSQNLWYQGKELAKEGVTLLGHITSVKAEAGAGYYQVRIPAIHGYCDINEQNCEEDVVAKESLPWIASLQSGKANAYIRNNDPMRLAKGQQVLVRFEGPNYSSPVIISTHKQKHPVLGGEENSVTTGPQVIAATVGEAEGKDQKNLSAAYNGCYKVVTKASKIPDNGRSAGGANKCGENGGINSALGALIGDFMKIVQDTDGKIGSKFVSSTTGELFSISGYIQKYLAAITGVIRGGISWVKAIITKEARKIIDLLVQKIMVPIKGVTSIVNETIEKILNAIGCSFGDIEGMISNMIEGLLNTLVDSALNSVFGCLDTLVDGILNEIMSEVLGLVGDIMGMIESIAGFIGGFGDMLGEAVNAVLDFLGISCGGAGDCATAASSALVTAFNNPGEFGMTQGLKKNLNSGLDAINGVSGSIGKATAELNAEAEAYAKGVDLGTANVPGVSANNEALKNAFTTANNLVADSVSNVFDFCGNLSAGNDGSTGASTTPSNPGDDPSDNGGYTPSTTTAVVIGAIDDKYDAVYTMYPVGESTPTGGSQKIKIKRNVSEEEGIIIFAVHLKSTDTARVVGITPGVTSGGDLQLQQSLDDGQYATNPEGSSSPTFPIKGNVVRSEKIYFPAGVSEQYVDVSTLNNTAPEGETEVTYTATIYRAVDDLDLNKYPYKNTPSTSNVLNSAQLKITFPAVPTEDPEPTVTVTPPAMVFKNINYAIDNVSVTAGQPAQFKVSRSPLMGEKTQIKCVTSDGTAIDGTHYTGGTGVLTFEPGKSFVIFSVPTIGDNSLINQSLDFSVTFTDVLLPQGSASNLGGVGGDNGTTAGEGIVKTAAINYTPTSEPKPYCGAELLIKEAPPTCVIQEEDSPFKLGVSAKVSVPGYVITYQWQRTYDPDGTWTDITNGSRTESVDELVTTYGPSDITFIDGNGQSVTLDGWETSTVTQTPSITYSGATDKELLVAAPSYLIMDEEYYRCVITATPNTPSIYTPTLTHTTANTYVGITKDGVYSSTVNCAPPGTLPDGNTITYTNTASPAGVGASFELYEDYKPKFTSENIPGKPLSAKFSSDGSGIEVSGEDSGNDAIVKVRFEWDDNPKTSGQSVGTLYVNGTEFSQGSKEEGSIEKTLYLKSGNTYKFSYSGRSSGSGTQVSNDQQIIKWDDDIDKSGFDENARMTILSVSGTESKLVEKIYNDFTAGFYPKGIGDYAQHTYSGLNWNSLTDFYEGDFTLTGGNGSGLIVKARFEAFPNESNEPGNMKYKIIAILDPGDGNYDIGDELTFPDQGGYSFGGAGALMRVLTPDFGIDENAGVCEVVEPTREIPDDIDIPEPPGPDDDPDDDPEPTVLPNPTGPFVTPVPDTHPPIPRTPVVVGPPGGVVSVPIPPGLPKYKYPPLIPITGLGTGAVAKADIDDDGNLINIIVKSTGVGYTPSQFDQCGILTSIEITNVGGFYESSPTVYVNDDPTIAVAAINDRGQLAEIRITNPKNIVYDKIPRIVIQGDGVGGSGIGVIQYVPCPNVAEEYLKVVNKYNDSKLGTVRVVDCP